MKPKTKHISLLLIGVLSIFGFLQLHSMDSFMPIAAPDMEVASEKPPDTVISKDTAIFIIPLAPKHFDYVKTNVLPYFAALVPADQVHVAIVFSTAAELKEFGYDFNNDNAQIADLTMPVPT